jgi:hypothetical protein
MRRERPFLFTNLKSGEGLAEVLRWLEGEMQAPRRSIIDAHAPYPRRAHGHEHA